MQSLVVRLVKSKIPLIMCFSATASFGASIALTAIGVASVSKIQMRSQILFASIPILFAMQQLTEGFLWLTFTHPGHPVAQNFATYSFLFIAQIIWPTWVPLSIFYLMKPDERT